jgi:hypothetical protein
MHLIHSIEPKTHILRHFGPFCYCTKVDAKLAELVPLTYKFAERSFVEIFPQQTPLIHSIEPKTHILVPLTCKFAEQSRVRIFRNERTRSTLLDPKLMF